VEHRDCHNMYGMMQQQATAEGHIKRSDGQDRPFVLSRAFFAGTQQYGAIWTGDNTADWGHLAAAAPMLLTLGLAGLPFSGADVGGFFNNPDAELLVRWYQAGAFTPFFRGHAHIETKRREPWLFGEDNTNLIRSAIRKRYQYMPLWYTLFHMASKDGSPMIRPMWVEFDEPDLFGIEDQYMVGSSILVKPVTAAGQTTTEVVLPGDEVWYDAETHQEQASGRISVPTPIGKMPLFFRAGQVIPRRDRPRRNTVLMANDPYTFIVTPNKAGTASGELYVDDGKTFNFQKNQYVWRTFEFADGKLTSSPHPMASKDASFSTTTTIERIIVLGLSAKPSSVRAEAAGSAPVTLESMYNAQLKELVIRKPNVPVSGDWTILIK